MEQHNFRITEWETGLPNLSDLPPLSHVLISPDLASAFSITPESFRSMVDVDSASRDTLASLRGGSQVDGGKLGGGDGEDEVVVDGGGGGEEGGGEGEDEGRLSKRVRLVWTPQLHKRFIEVVGHLGVKKAVPKTIMELMNVEGLTRENVASHLQKYRLYVKRMRGGSSDGLSPSDSGGGSESENRRASVPVQGQGQGQFQAPMPYPPPPQIVPGGGGGVYRNGFEYRSHPYTMMMQPNDWSGNNLGSVSAYQQRVTPNRK